MLHARSLQFRGILTQIRDNFSIIRGKHTFKVGGEWLHTKNTQIFRGFFKGRYIFDSPVGFMHYVADGSRLSCDAPDSFHALTPIARYGPLDQYLMGVRSRDEMDSLLVLADTIHITCHHCP